MRVLGVALACALAGCTSGPDRDPLPGDLVIDTALAPQDTAAPPDSADTEPPEPDLLVVETERSFVIEFDGCTASPATVDGGDVALTIPAGACLQTREGRRITGRVILGIGPAPALEPASDAALGPAFGYVDAWLRLMDADGGARLDVVSDPPPRLDVRPAQERTTDGLWSATWYAPSASARAVQGFPGWKPVAAGGLDASGPVPAAFRPARIDFRPHAGAPAQVGLRVIGEVALGAADAAEYPTLRSLAIRNQETGQTVRAAAFWPGLRDAGTERLLDAPWEPLLYDVQIVDRDGQRFAQVRSARRNRHEILAGIGESVNAGDVRWEAVQTTEDAPDEAETTGSYEGHVEVDVHSRCLSLSASRRVEGQVRDWAQQTHADAQVRLERWRRARGETTFTLRVHRFPSSVRVLGGRFPQDWTSTAGDRHLSVDFPCAPPPVLVASEPDQVALLDDDLTVLASATLSGLPLEAVLADDLAYVASEGTVDVVDLGMGGVVRTVVVPGLGSGLALDADGMLLAAVPGALEIRDPATLDLLDAIAIEDLEWSGVAVSEDGAYAYLWSRSGGTVAEVDRLRHRQRRLWRDMDLRGLDVTSDGAALVFLEGDLGIVGFFDLVSATRPPTLPVTAEVGGVHWAADDSVALLLEPSLSGVLQIDPRGVADTYLVQTDGPPTSLTSWRDGDGAVRVLVGGDAVLLSYTLTDPTADPTDFETHIGLPGTRLVRVPGH